MRKPHPASLIALCLSLALVNIVTGQAATQPSSADSDAAIAQQLIAARSRHRDATANVKTSFLKVIDERIAAATEAGDLKLVDQLQGLKASTESDAVLSDALTDPVVFTAKDKYDRALAIARMRLIDAYHDAIRDYGRANELDQAQSAEDELRALMADDPTMRPRVINLLNIVDPKRDALSGNWYLNGDELTNDPSNCSQIRFPYRPPAEYDYHVVYDRAKAEWGLALGVCYLGDTFGCGMPDWKDYHGIGTFQGILSSVRYNVLPDAAEHCDVCVQVRTDRLTILINGQKSFDRAMSQWNFQDIPSWFAGPYRQGLGVVDWYGQTTISKAEVTEMTGIGEILNNEVSR
jgi:hypothetical protein